MTFPLVNFSARAAMTATGAGISGPGSDHGTLTVIRRNGGLPTAIAIFSIPGAVVLVERFGENPTRGALRSSVPAVEHRRRDLTLRDYRISLVMASFFRLRCGAQLISGHRGNIDT